MYITFVCTIISLDDILVEFTLVLVFLKEGDMENMDIGEKN